MQFRAEGDLVLRFGAQK